MPRNKGFLLSRQPTAGWWKSPLVVSETNQPLCSVEGEDTDLLSVGREYRLTVFDHKVEDTVLLYGSGDILLVMSILYPWADLKKHFHIDHMFPKSLFTRKRIQKLGVPENQIDFYIDNVNYIGNLQLLEELPNKEKNNTEFKTWLEQHYADADKLKAYREKHYIPNVGVEFTNFEEFFLEREKLLVKALKAALI